MVHPRSSLSNSMCNSATCTNVGWYMPVVTDCMVCFGMMVVSGMMVARADQDGHQAGIEVGQG